MNKFEFHGIGQGLFYSGRLLDGRFNFVYDCGSSNSKESLEKEIERLPEELGFVVISHLHNDHINGLVKLLEKCEVKKIYLPYFKFAGCESVLLSYMVINGIDVKSSVFKILKNVYLLLNKKQKEKQKEENITEIKLQISDNNLKDLLSEEDLQNDKLRKHLKQVTFVCCKDDEFTHVEEDKKIAQHYWRFRFFNKIIDEKIIKNLNDNIKELLERSSCGSIEDYIRNNGLNNLKGIYEKVLGKDLNITSLILLHYPRHCCCCTKQTLLTGDAVFDDDLNYRVGSYLNSNIILQVPHHGAYNEWLLLSEDIKMNSQKFVFSFGLDNKYHHPSKKVLNDIKVNGWGYKNCFVNEDKGYVYPVDDCGCFRWWL